MRQLALQDIEVKIEKRTHGLVGHRFSIFRENLLGNTAISAPTNFYTLNISFFAETLLCCDLDSTVPGAISANKRAIDIPKEQALFFHCGNPTEESKLSLFLSWG